MVDQSAQHVGQTGLRAAFISDRQQQNTTELFLYLPGVVAPRVCLLLASQQRGGELGYAVLDRAGEEEGPGGVTVGLYELTQLLAAGSPYPGPVVALSGVLWTRREVLAQLEAGDASLPLAGLRL